MSLGILVGINAEARIARRRFPLVCAGGGTGEGAAKAAEGLLAAGATALISFGLAGGLDPALRPGDALVPRFALLNGVRVPITPALAGLFGGPTHHTILAASTMITTCLKKHRLFHETGAHAVDLETAAVARSGVPFAVVRAICDPAERTLPAAAVLGLKPGGGINLAAILGSVLRDPGQIPSLLALAKDAAAGRRTLVRLAGSAAEC